jgi:hypothetical protein
VLSFCNDAANSRALGSGGTTVLTFLRFAGSAIVGVFYVTILIALATRKKKPAAVAQPEPLRRFDPTA